MKSKIKQAIRSCLYWYRQRKHEKFYNRVMHINGIKDVEVKGEKEWLKRWSQFGIKAKPTQYRVFRQYIGDDINIVPEDICHDYIETILNPMRFRGYYADKNVFDKLFPQDYFPKTLLRKMCGFYYDKAYQPLSMTEEKLLCCLNDSPTDRIIIKPSVDGMSGRGVEAFIRIGGVIITG